MGHSFSLQRAQSLPQFLTKELSSWNPSFLTLGLADTHWEKGDSEHSSVRTISTITTNTTIINPTIIILILSQ